MHTQGPWFWDRDLYHQRLEPNVLEIYISHGGGWEPTEEDARLIAAAPDLLAALEGIMAAPMSTKAMLAAHAAIAKARGK